MNNVTVYSEILGNINSDPQLRRQVEQLRQVEHIHLDQWTAQKSRFLGRGDQGGEYAVALARNSRVKDGDLLVLDPEGSRAVVISLDLSEVLVVDLARLATEDTDTIIRHSVELGHAIGNQHWPAVVRGTKVYVPLTVDRKVMLSVLETHHIEDITYAFEPGSEVIPYLAPHEIRRLFGGASHESHAHHSHTHPHDDHEHHHDHDHHHAE